MAGGILILGMEVVVFSVLLLFRLDFFFFFFVEEPVVDLDWMVVVVLLLDFSFAFILVFDADPFTLLTLSFMEVAVVEVTVDGFSFLSDFDRALKENKSFL